MAGGCSCPLKPFRFLLVPVLLLNLTAIVAGHVAPPGTRDGQPRSVGTPSAVRGKVIVKRREDSGAKGGCSRAGEQQVTPCNGQSKRSGHLLPAPNPSGQRGAASPFPSKIRDTPRTDLVAPLKVRRMQVVAGKLAPGTTGIWVPNDGIQIALSWGLRGTPGGPVGVGQRRGAGMRQGSSNITCPE